MRTLLPIVLCIVSGCGQPARPPGIRAGSRAVLLDDDPREDTILIYAEKYNRGFTLVPAGTHVTVIGEGPPVMMIDAPAWRVKVDEGEYAGDVVGIPKSYVRSVPSSSP